MAKQIKWWPQDEAAARELKDRSIHLMESGEIGRKLLAKCIQAVVLWLILVFLTGVSLHGLAEVNIVLYLVLLVAGNAFLTFRLQPFPSPNQLAVYMDEVRTSFGLPTTIDHFRRLHNAYPDIFDSPEIELDRAYPTE